MRGSPAQGRSETWHRRCGACRPPRRSTDSASPVIAATGDQPNAITIAFQSDAIAGVFSSKEANPKIKRQSSLAVLATATAISLIVVILALAVTALAAVTGAPRRSHHLIRGECCG